MCEPVLDAGGNVIGIHCPSAVGATGATGPPGSTEAPQSSTDVDPYKLRSALVNIEIALTATNPATTLERRIERAVEQVHKALG